MMNVPLVSDSAAIVVAWGGPVPPAQLAAFMKLSADKREIALLRIAALQRLAAVPRPSTEMQRIEAKALGMGLKRLQALMRAWVNPDVAIVTPHGRKIARPRKPTPALEISARIIDKALSRNRMIAEPSVHRRIAAVCQRLRLRPPARMTVRTLLDRRRRELPPEIIVFDEINHAAEGHIAFGEVLLLAPQPFRIRILDADERYRPAIALFLVDVASEIILAANPIGEPLALGQSAARRVRQDLTSPVSWSRIRRLLLATPETIDETWTGALIDRARHMGVDVDYPLQSRTRRWMAALWRHEDGLAPIVSSSAEDRDDWPTITSDEFARLLELTVERHNFATNRLLDQLPYNPGLRIIGGEAADDIMVLFADPALPAIPARWSG